MELVPVCLCQVSQVMLGLMVISYSIPLHVTEFTEVVSLGVPWWSGFMVSVSAKRHLSAGQRGPNISAFLSPRLCALSSSQQVRSLSCWTDTAP